ncbi:MAG TPA: DUF4010 domain-containing protein [Pseudolabrys sp.]|nr:DUF4010 domain-containing protein [Pseudolabrys sp.]
MPLDPLFIKFALILGLSLFFGLAFEDFHVRAGLVRPGGIRTFPLLAISGGLLYALDPERKLLLASGVIVLGAWLLLSYRRQLREPQDDNRFSVELIVPICNVLALLIGPATLALPAWLPIGVTVTAVLLLTGRGRLHRLAQQVELGEIVTAAEFLILTGIVLPLLPDEPVTSLTTITPYKAWLALLAVCTLSYASYLVQRLFARADSDLLIAFLGGLYSSTATTVVLARAAGADPAANTQAQAGIILATAVMYLRLLAIVALFDAPLALELAPTTLAFSIAAFVLAALQFRRARGQASAMRSVRPRNPLELGTAVLFAVLFVATSIVAHWAHREFGALGIDSLAAVIGFTDIDPFVLSIAQGGGGLPLDAAAVAILIAISSNNVLKAVYTIVFAGRRASLPAAGALIALAACGVFVAIFT